MTVNLNQNPMTRPIASGYIPTLLQQGLMWVCKAPQANFGERWLLEDEHLVVMGWPMYAQLCAGSIFPLLNIDNISATNRKSLAGNVTLLINQNNIDVLSDMSLSF